MKREQKQRRLRRRWRIAWLVLVVHMVIYTSVWVMAMYRVPSIEGLPHLDLTSISAYGSVIQNQILYALLWLPFFVTHLGVHLYLAGRSDAGNGAREAYRDGFRDGAHYSEEAYTPRRLTLDEAVDEILEDDGEFVEWEGKRKRVER